MILTDDLSIILLIQQELVGKMLWDYLDPPSSIISNFDIAIRSSGSIQRLAIYYHFGREDQKKLVYGYLTENGIGLRLLWNNDLIKDSTVNTLKEFKDYFQIHITTDLLQQLSGTPDDNKNLIEENKNLKSIIKCIQKENTELRADLAILQEDYNNLRKDFTEQQNELTKFDDLKTKYESLNNEVSSLMLIIQEQESFMYSIQTFKDAKVCNKKCSATITESTPSTQVTETKLEMPEES